MCETCANGSPALSDDPRWSAGDHEPRGRPANGLELSGREPMPIDLASLGVRCPRCRQWSSWAYSVLTLAAIAGRFFMHGLTSMHELPTPRGGAGRRGVITSSTCAASGARTGERSPGERPWLTRARSATAPKTFPHAAELATPPAAWVCWLHRSCSSRRPCRSGLGSSPVSPGRPSCACAVAPRRCRVRLPCCSASHVPRQVVERHVIWRLR